MYIFKQNSTEKLIYIVKLNKILMTYIISTKVSFRGDNELSYTFKHHAFALSRYCVLAFN